MASRLIKKNLSIDLFNLKIIFISTPCSRYSCADEWYKMSAFARLIFVIFLTDLAYKAEFGKECNGPRQLPISGMMLQRHIFDKRMTRSGYAECLFVCREEKVCQSFNFVISENACEFNNRTKEASPKDFVPNPDRYYVKRDVSRGINSTYGLVCYRLH